jgi:uncharacterized protein with von Willebrand factor type A (vWA) domain
MEASTDSRLAQNLVLFCRTLRRAGLPVGPGQVVEAAQAVARVGVHRRDDFRVALRSVLVNEPDQFRIFDQAFHIYFRNPRLLERMMGMLLPTLQRDDRPAGAVDPIRRLIEAMSSSDKLDEEEVVIEIDRAGSYSRREILQRKDFEQMSLEEQAEARILLRNGIHFLRDVPTRRFRPSTTGGRFDARRSLQLMARNNGQLIDFARRRRRYRPPNLVLLCDISGSMSSYSRMFLNFSHVLAGNGRGVHSFVFGTRLTNVSRWLAISDVDKAIQKVSADVVDWDGGTRIADCLREFNMKWGRRVLAGRSVVVLLTDGLERDAEHDLRFETERLQRSTRQLIWLNPMLRYDRFEPRAQGVKAMLPVVDEFMPAHNVAGLLDLAALLEKARSGSRGIAA